MHPFSLYIPFCAQISHICTLYIYIPYLCKNKNIMKRFLSIVISVVLLCSCAKTGESKVEEASHKVHPHFCEVNEVLSVAMYLAGAEEYNWSEYSDYINDIDEYFAPFKDHELIKSIESYHGGGFGYDLPMGLAHRLKIVDGEVIARDNVVPDTVNYYKRISPTMETVAIEQINDFYKVSDFHTFYEQHKALYQEAEAAFRKITDSIDLAWFDQFFFPDSTVKFDVVLSIINGPANYSTTIDWTDGTKSIVSTMGCCDQDTLGLPVYDLLSTLPVLIHEWCHGYCNPLIDEFWEGIEPVAQKYFEMDADFFTRGAYPAAIYMMHETFVEASVVRYLMSHPIDCSEFGIDDLAEFYLKAEGEENKHYQLERCIVEALDARVNNPSQYPTMRDFMPEIVKAVQKK